MHSITLKSNDMFYNILKSTVEKERLVEQVKMASFKVRDESLKSAKEFDATTSDGLIYPFQLIL